MGSAGTLRALEEKNAFQQHNMAVYFSTILDACFVVWALQFTSGIEHMVFARTTARRYWLMWIKLTFSRDSNEFICFRFRAKDFLYDCDFSKSISECYLGSTTLEAIVITIMPTISSLLETLKRNFIIYNFPFVDGFINALYKKLHFFSGKFRNIRSFVFDLTKHIVTIANLNVVPTHTHLVSLLGSGLVILFNVRTAVTTLAWNLLLGFITVVTLIAGAFW